MSRPHFFVTTQRGARMRSRYSRNKLVMLVAFVGCAALCCTPAFSQAVDSVNPPVNAQVVNLVDRPVNVVTTFDLPIGQSSDQSPPAASALSRDVPLDISEPARGLAFYTAK